MKLKVIQNILHAAILACAVHVSAGNGAVKTDLMDIQSNELAGWAILNTTANNLIKATVHLNGGQPDTTYHVCVHIVLPSGEHACAMVAELVTNRGGTGTTHGTRSIPEGISPLLAGVHLGVVMHEPLYETALVELPLKK
jgi:hypothetical protein